jgi:hypothetical protein
MKKAFILLTICIGLCTSSLFAQDVIRLESCNDSLISVQVDSLKKIYGSQGFEVFREASIKMESEYEMPVVLQLQERIMYQIVFIGEYTSKLYEVRMYDWDEKMVTYQKKQWGDVDGNVISFNYIPKFTEFHMIKPVQVNKKKKKGLCGYVMIFHKVRAGK